VVGAPLTVLVDDRVGSEHLLGPLQAAGVAAEETRLPCGDVAILGPDGVCGVELKRLSDAVKCVSDGRFAGTQLEPMLQSYAATYLVVEGNYRCGPGGAIEVPIGGFWDTPGWARHTSYLGLRKWILTQELNGGARVRETRFPADTLGFIAALASWWQAGRKAHSSHLATDLSFQTLSGDDWIALGPRLATAALMLMPLPGLGNDRAKAAATYFGAGSVPTREVITRAMAATPKEWQKVPGVGKVTAREVGRRLDGCE
jgi:hypothetical protein